MNKNKEPGKAAGLLSLALALAFSLAACGGDDDGSPGGSVSVGNGNLNSVEALPLDGTVYEVYYTGEYSSTKAYRQMPKTLSFKIDTSNNYNGRIGGTGTVKEGKLTFTSLAVEEDKLLKLDNSNFLDYITRGALDSGDYEAGSFKVSDAAVKLGYIEDYLSLKKDDGSPTSSLLTRERETESGDTEIDHYAYYVYATGAVTISATGKSTSYTSSGYTYTDKTTNLSLSLTKGWNVLYYKETDTGNSGSSNTEKSLTVGNPDVYWLISGYEQ